MAYEPGNVPDDPAALPGFLREELAKLQRNDYAPQNVFRLNPLAAPPTKPRKGDHYYADGTNWNPGSGEGTYRFNGTTYVLLG